MMQGINKAEWRSLACFLAVSLAFLVTPSAFAQLSGGTFEIRRSQFTGGGGSSSGGSFTVFGTAGQHDAGDLTGATFVLRGGFIQPRVAGLVCPGGTNAECNDANVCTFDQCVAGVCDSQPSKYGDIDGSGAVNIFDLFCMLDGLNDVFSTCSFEAVNLSGGTGVCTPDSVINIFDLFALLDALNAMDPCCGGLP